MSVHDTTAPPGGGRADHCGYCGRRIAGSALQTERFGERFCSEAHGAQFAAGVREARMRAAAQVAADTTGPAPGACHVSPPGRTWKDVLKRSACWAAPLLLLLALPLFWTGTAWGAAGGSVLGLVATLACPIAIFVMMRAMMPAGQNQTRRGRGDADRTSSGARGMRCPLSARWTALAAAAVLAAAPSPARAGSTAFEHVHALAIDAGGAHLWLGAHTGLFRSEDGGRSWIRVPMSGAQAHDVMAIAAHPSRAETLYVGTHDTGILRTTDAGKTWTVVNTGLGGLDVHGLAIDPNIQSKLHALVREGRAGLYRSVDMGGTWVRVDDGPAGETKVLASVNIQTGMGGIFLYAGTAEGLRASPDCF